MSFEVVVTRGGARAVRDVVAGEVMHPVVGPRAEADALYVGPSRLAERLGDSGPPLVVFDVGLGAGSNAIAAWRAAAGRPLSIVSFDRTTCALALALEHAADFDLEGDAGDAARALIATGTASRGDTTWRLVPGELPETIAGAGARADIVFWDPFSPRANPSLWTVAAFSALRAACNDRATVHTYSAATSTRAALLLAGFAVGVGAATGAKQQTTIAAVDPASLAHPLDARWLERLARSTAPLPDDAPADANERIRSRPQFLR